MSPLASLTITLVVLALLAGAIWLVCYLFASLHECVDDLVHDRHAFFPVRVIAGIIYVFTSIVMFLVSIVLLVVGGYAAMKGAEQARDWWNNKG